MNERRNKKSSSTNNAYIQIDQIELTIAIVTNTRCYILATLQFNVLHKGIFVPFSALVLSIYTHAGVLYS